MCVRRQPPPAPAAPRGEAGSGRRTPLRMAAAPGDRRGKPPRGRAARAMFPQPDALAGVPGPAYGGGRRRPPPPRPRHVRTIFEAPPPPEPPHRFGPAAAGTWCDLCCRFVLSQGLRCAVVAAGHTKFLTAHLHRKKQPLV